MFGLETLAMKTYDPRCAELAEHFLAGEEHVDPAKVERLALHIQQAIEDWFDPTPWCAGCGAMIASKCTCGPIAENN
jgi:hypothetical protein